MGELGSEEHFMLMLARLGTQSARCTTKLDARRVLELATYHRMLPDAAEACRRIEAELPGSVVHLDDLVNAAETALRITRERIEATAPVLSALTERMPVMVAKGLYMRDIANLCSGRRTMGDVDVYIAEDDVEEAVAICETFGATPNVNGARRELYRRNRGQFALEGGQISIDLHWWLNNNPLHRDASAFCLQTVLEGAKRADWQGIPLLVPSAEDALLLNAVYMTYENWGHVLRMYVDHKSLATAADPVRAIVRAKDVGLFKALVTTLEATSAVTGLELGGAWRRSLTGVGNPLRYREAFAVLTDGPGEPSSVTRWKEESISRRRRFSRFLIRIDEYARVLRLADMGHRRDTLVTLLWPGRRFGQFYLTDKRWAWFLHPFALAMGSGTLAWRATRDALGS